MGDQKTYFVVMQDSFNALYRRRLVSSCHMRCAGNADDVLVLDLDLWFNVFS